jgi:hypothetical protein
VFYIVGRIGLDWIAGTEAIDDRLSKGASKQDWAFLKENALQGMNVYDLTVKLAIPYIRAVWVRANCPQIWFVV